MKTVSVGTCHFDIQLHAHGVKRCGFLVAGIEAGLVGDYYNGKPYQPDTTAVHDMLPYQYRKAFDRALKWWQDSSMSGRVLPLKCELKTLKGKPMGTLFATPAWSNEPVA